LIFLITYADDTLEFEYSYSLMLSRPDESPLVALSTTSCMAWTSDGLALAAGWKNGGVAVWSLQGHLLTSANIDDPRSQDFAPGESLNDSFFKGVEKLFWGYGDYELFILSANDYERDQFPKLYGLQISKIGYSLEPNSGNSRNMFLVCDDHLLIYEGNFSDVDVLNLDPLQWRTIQMPASYMARQWPIRCASIDFTGSFLAVAGKHGFTHYSLMTGKWKIFGSERQEQAFRVSHLVWIRSYIVTAYQVESIHRYNIVVFSKDDNLDLNSSVCSISSSQPIIAMNNQDVNLLVYFGDNSLNYYVLEKNSCNS
jgi:hypothetical protein